MVQPVGLLVRGFWQGFSGPVATIDPIDKQLHRDDS